MQHGNNLQHGCCDCTTKEGLIVLTIAHELLKDGYENITNEHEEIFAHRNAYKQKKQDNIVMPTNKTPCFDQQKCTPTMRDYCHDHRHKMWAANSRWHPKKGCSVARATRTEDASKDEPELSSAGAVIKLCLRSCSRPVLPHEIWGVQLPIPGLH